MRHQVKLDASFLSLVIAVAVVEVFFCLSIIFPILPLLEYTILWSVVVKHNI